MKTGRNPPPPGPPGWLRHNGSRAPLQPVDHHHAGAVPGPRSRSMKSPSSSSTRSRRRASLGRGGSTGHRVWRWGPGQPPGRTERGFVHISHERPPGGGWTTAIRPDQRPCTPGSRESAPIPNSADASRPPDLDIPSNDSAALAEGRAASLPHVRSRDWLRRRRASERMPQPDPQAPRRHGLRAPPASAMLAAGTYAWRGGRHNETI